MRGKVLAKSARDVVDAGTAVALHCSAKEALLAHFLHETSVEVFVAVGLLKHEEEEEEEEAEEEGEEGEEASAYAVPAP